MWKNCAYQKPKKQDKMLLKVKLYNLRSYKC